MTEYRQYMAGEKHFQWKINMAIYQNNDSYKYVLAADEDEMYIATGYVMPSTANELERTIESAMYYSNRYENMDDVFEALLERTYGTMFSKLWTISPNLSDAVLLLAVR